MMPFSQKIYCCDKPLILTHDANEYVAKHPSAAGYLTLTGAFTRNFRLAFEHLTRPRTTGAIIEDTSSQALQDALYECCQPIEAAGGVVENERGDVLMIYRRGRWDLPKGKRDEGESIEACALREVQEETGLLQLSLGEKIGVTHHIYAQGLVRLVKTTYWFRMNGQFAETPIPQAEENIQEARWVSLRELGPIAFKSYCAIREVLFQAGIRW
ncbi:MAG: NUDIX domain-containing protein [Bacteroidetes bacterium]|nr:NUDIX domain-containing protein [Bacteroidota bacterium]MBS1629713.1 NUDIX domain-containing protein [Bacteroidota bacterium]